MDCIVDKKIMSERFKRSVQTYHQEAAVQRQIAAHLCRLVGPYVAQPVSLLEIGCGTGFLTQEILEHLPVSSALFNDINPEVEPFIRQFLSKERRFAASDAETVPFSNRFDLIMSSSVIQWFNNVESFICKIPSVLTENGIIALSTFGTQNMQEIKKMTGVSLPYPDIRKYLNPHFQILHYEEHLLSIPFKTPIEVLKHLKNTGVNGIQKTHWGIKQLHDFQKKYEQFYKTESGVCLTYHPVYIIAQKK